MTDMIKISAIDASDRLRPVDIDRAALIAASIEDGKLEQPIVVRPRGDGYKLTSGAHRLAAVQSLGWEELTIGEHVIVREQDDLDAKLSEIDENLARHELNALDRALFMVERKRVYEERRRVNAKGGDRKSNKFKEEIKSQSLTLDFSPRFTLDAAKRTGMSEAIIKLAVRIAERLDPEAIRAIRGTMVERNQQELLALAEMEPEGQREAAALIASGGAKTVRLARFEMGVDKRPTDDPQAKIFATLLDAWRRASAQTRKQFEAHIKAGARK